MSKVRCGCYACMKHDANLEKDKEREQWEGDIEKLRGMVDRAFPKIGGLYKVYGRLPAICIGYTKSDLKQGITPIFIMIKNFNDEAKSWTSEQVAVPLDQVTQYIELVF